MFRTLKKYGLSGGEPIKISTVEGFSFLDVKYNSKDIARKTIRSITVVKEYPRHILFEITSHNTGESYWESLNKSDLLTGEAYFELAEES